MSEGNKPQERHKVQAGTLRNQSDDQIKRIIHDMRQETASNYGLLRQQRNNPTRDKSKPTPLVDPRNRFRRRVVARCLTILRERGVKFEG